MVQVRDDHLTALTGIDRLAPPIHKPDVTKIDVYVIAGAFLTLETDPTCLDGLVGRVEETIEMLLDHSPPLMQDGISSEDPHFQQADVPPPITYVKKEQLSE
jgi:hypothetical protein